jgi:hypothetical protein
MRKDGWSTARRGTAWRRGLGAVTFAVAMTGFALEASAVAPTLSGLPISPYGERTLRVTSRGVGIRFRAPADATLDAVHLLWRRAADECRVALRAGDANGPAAEIVAADVPQAAGWVPTPLHAALVAGEFYHLVIACGEASAARLGFALDADGTGLTTGAWRIEDLRPDGVRLRRAPATPLFALQFSDGTWWGQPYRGRGRRPLIRICRANEVRQTVVSRQALVVDGVELPRSRDGASDPVTFAVGDAPADSEVEMAPGTAYTLHIRGADGSRCFRARGLMTDLAHGPSLAGVEAADLRVSSDGGVTWEHHPEARLSLNLLNHRGGNGGGNGGGGTDGGGGTGGGTDGGTDGGGTPPSVCGDGVLAVGEECDGAAGEVCPGRCTDTCTCAPPPPTCGDGVVNAAGEVCDGADAAACPGLCTTDCTCPAPPARTYKSIYGGGYFGNYDGNTGPTVTEWPKKLRILQGSAWGQGPLVAKARQDAQAAGNGDARFVFYFSLSLLDPACGCFSSSFYDSFVRSHPEWILKDGSGNRVTKGREYAVDIGNPAYMDAWIAWAIAPMNQYGWDGVWVDNVLRGSFYGWSATPVNPRTGQRYTVDQYRRDMLAALQRLRNALDARGKIFVGNQSSAWDAATFADPLIQEQIKTMHGVRIEDCIYDFNGNALSESNWIAQLRYLDFANRHGVFSQCQGVGGSLRDGSKRSFLLTSYLLTKEGFSDVDELNTVGDWWSDLATDLGMPQGGYACLDPNAGYARTGTCPATGNVYVREWAKGRVLVNPSPSSTRTVPLGGTFLLRGSPVTQVTLGPRSGAILLRP